MTVKTKILAGAVALALGATASQAANSASVDRQFRDAVAHVLDGVRSGNDYLSGLTASQFRAFVACAQDVMDSAPLARKQYVLAASNANAQRQRFDEVALDNRAQLKQKIAQTCAN